MKKTPLRKVEMALACVSTGVGGHGGVDERERVFAAQCPNGRRGRPAADRRRGAVAPAAATAWVPAAQGSSDRRRGEPGVQAPRQAEQQQAAGWRSGSDNGAHPGSLRRFWTDACVREACGETWLPRLPRDATQMDDRGRALAGS